MNEDSRNEIVLGIKDKCAEAWHFSPYSASGFRERANEKKKIFLDGPRATRSLIKKKKRWDSGDENGGAGLDGPGGACAPRSTKERRLETRQPKAACSRKCVILKRPFKS